MRIQITNWKDYGKIILASQIDYFIMYLFVAIFIAIAIKIINLTNQFNNTFNALLISIQAPLMGNLLRQAYDICTVVGFAIQTVLLSLFCCKKTITKFEVYSISLAGGAIVIFYAIIEFFNVIDGAA